MKINKQKMEIVGFALVAFISFILLNQNKIVLLSPNNYGEITDTRPEFAFSSGLEKYRIVIDDDPDFSSPLVNEVIENERFRPDFGLSFGRYYWKVIGFKDGKVYQSKTSVFEVLSVVATRNNIDSIRNVGNTRIEVKEKLETPAGYSVVGLVVLDVGEFVFRNQTKNEVIAEQV